MAYITCQDQYEGQPGWALAAILVVVEQFQSHADASDWYQNQKYAVPSNCIVSGNPPQPYQFTNGKLPAEVMARVDVEEEPERAVKLWDAMYAIRARNCGVFLACRADFLELWRPPILRRSDLLDIFGRLPVTQNPPKITSDEFHALETFAKNKTATQN